jgi:hypothetical protein
VAPQGLHLGAPSPVSCSLYPVCGSTESIVFETKCASQQRWEFHIRTSRNLYLSRQPHCVSKGSPFCCGQRRNRGHIHARANEFGIRKRGKKETATQIENKNNKNQEKSSTLVYLPNENRELWVDVNVRALVLAAEAGVATVETPIAGSCDTTAGNDTGAKGNADDEPPALLDGTPN